MTSGTGTCERSDVSTRRIDPPAALTDSLFEGLVHEHQSTLRKLAVRLSGNGADAEDLVADTLERALGHFERLAPGSNVRAWLVTIMRNLAFDRLRTRARRGVAIEVDPNTLPDPGREADDGDSRWSEVTVGALEAALDEIDQGQRLVFVMFHLDNLSYAEISQRLGVPTNTVGSRLARARQRLCKLLKKKGHERGM